MSALVYYRVNHPESKLMTKYFVRLRFTAVFQTKMKQPTACPQPATVFQSEQGIGVYGVAAIHKQMREERVKLHPRFCHCECKIVLGT